jgi:hypothetical protein
MSHAELLTRRDGVDLGEKGWGIMSRRTFLSLLAPLPLIPVVGPYALLSEKPTQLGWTNARTYQFRGGGFDWRTVAERTLLKRDLEREIGRRQRLGMRI